jgi:protein-disulfide isomerase
MEDFMVRRDKFVLGLLVSLFAISPVLGDAKDMALGTSKAEEPKGAAKDIPASASSGDSQKTESLVSDEAKGLIESSPMLGTNEGEKSIEATPTAAIDSGKTGELSDAEFEKKLTDTVNKNPQIIVTALQKFTENQERELQEKMEASFMKYKDEISKESSATLLGKKDAEVKLVVFLDPNCPHCRPFTQALHKVRENFPNVAVLIRHWPILKDSDEVVRGLWAIKRQGQDKYNAACKAIASAPSEERYTFAKLLAWVEDHNLNVKQFKEDSQSKETIETVEETSKLAKNIGLQGTPTSLLVDKNGVHLVMPTYEKSLESIFKGVSAPVKGAATPAAA